MKTNRSHWTDRNVGKLAMAVLLAGFLGLFTAQIHAQAVQEWVQRYNGPGNAGDTANAVAVDASGNVYVTGSSTGSGSFQDYATIKYSSAGVPLWTNLYNGPGSGDDWPYAMALDGSNNVIVTGYSPGSGSFQDYATIKYSSAGVPLWTNRHGGPGTSSDASRSVAVDASGNVYVTGASGGDYATVAYSSAGLPLWTNRYNGPGNGSDSAQAVAVDASGNVYVTGSSYNGDPGSGGTGDDYATIKYSSAGVPLWTNRYNGPNNLADRAYAVAVDASGDVVVTGDPATIKYSSEGLPLWTNVNGVGAVALAVDPGGNVVVTGRPDSSGNSDYATIKYSSTRVPLWTNYYNGPGNGSDGARAVAVDHDGNVIVTGDSPGSGTGADYATIAYSNAGMPLWTNRYNGPANSYDQARAVAVDASGSVYVTGSSTGSGSGADYATVKYVIPPIIIRQPLSRTNAVGTTAFFTVEVAGAQPLNYQWRREGTNLVDGSNLSGVTTTNLVIANFQLADACGYSIVITNAYGSTTSSVAQLTVYVPPNPGRFTKLSYSPEDGFSFTFRDGTVGQPYHIQTSTSLAEASWVDWFNFTYTGPISLTDSGAVGSTNRFYRAISP